VKKAKICEQVGLITYGKKREFYMKYGPHVARHGFLEQSQV